MKTICFFLLVALMPWVFFGCGSAGMALEQSGEEQAGPDETQEANFDFVIINQVSG